MAVEIGTATGYKDLLAKLRTFLTGLAVNPWTSLRYTVGGGTNPDELILRAPGLAGTDQIYVGITTFENATADYFNWRLAGFTGYNAALAFGAQPGVMQKVHLTLWNSPIPYWFVANGRRVIIVAKVSTFYMTGYLGFINQYPSPNQYPYPLIVGGNWAIDPEPALTSVSWRWSNTFFTNTNFPMSTSWDPGGGIIRANTSTLRIRKPDGTWGFMRAGSNGAYQDLDDSTIWPYMAGMANLQANLGADQSPVFPIILHDNTPEVFGELDGVYATSGQARASEDTITVGADSLLVVQNVMRTGRNTYCAVKLA
jgi:hypothetical protein